MCCDSGMQRWFMRISVPGKDMMAQMDDEMRLKNKVAIVTGASRGIGKAIALAYAKEGAAVVLASRSLDLLTAAENQIKAAGGEAMALSLDVRNPASVNSVVDKTVKNMAGWTSSSITPASPWPILRRVFLPKIGQTPWKRICTESFTGARPQPAS